MKQSRSKLILQYVIGILIPLAVGGLSAFLTRKNMKLPESIKMPSLSPPPMVFGIVWAILFILMGIGSVMVYRELKATRTRDKTALWIYLAQLVVNFAWNIAFFNFRAFLFTFLWLILLEVLIIWMIYEFYKINPFAAVLQVPYALWVAFAGYLNFSIWILNR